MNMVNNKETNVLDDITKPLTDDELSTFVKELEGTFRCGLFKQEDWREVKKSGEKFLKYAYKYKPKIINLSNRSEREEKFFRELLYRILMGIGCELIVKAVYLKEGYIINRYKIKKSRFPAKLGSMPDKKLNPFITFDINILISCFHTFFPKIDKMLYNRWISKGLQIARIWRNKDIHNGGRYHMETGMDVFDIETSLIAIYDHIFNDKDSLLQMLNINDRCIPLDSE